MKKTVSLLLLVLLLSGITGYVLYNAWLGSTMEASGPVSATALPETSLSDPSPVPAKIIRLEIDQENSEARFIIYEELEGKPVNVVGATDQIAGQIEIDLNDLAKTRLGEIRINARTFITDADRRNRAIRNRILFTDDHEFITFTPTRLDGLSGPAETGQSIKFTATGDLQIRESIRETSFEIEMKITGDNRISGTAATTVSRKDFDLKVPDLPFLANVADEVRLEFEGEFTPITEPDA